MMKLSEILIVLFLTISSDLLGQSLEDFICWNDDIKLKWSNFRGNPRNILDAKAGCAAKLSAQGYVYGGLPNFSVTNCFDCNTSWAIDTISTELLDHEQLHFDIAEIHARRMRKSVDSLRQLKEKSFDPYSVIIQDLLDRRNKIDSLYDKETAHSIYLDKQELWGKKIRDELESLKDYASQ